MKDCGRKISMMSNSLNNVKLHATVAQWIRHRPPMRVMGHQVLDDPE